MVASRTTLNFAAPSEQMLRSSATFRALRLRLRSRIWRATTCSTRRARKRSTASRASCVRCSGSRWRRSRSSTATGNGSSRAGARGRRDARATSRSAASRSPRTGCSSSPTRSPTRASATTRSSSASRGLRFYAGAPLRSSNGHCIGTLCAMDTRPRAFEQRRDRHSSRPRAYRRDRAGAARSRHHRRTDRRRVAAGVFRRGRARLEPGASASLRPELHLVRSRSLQIDQRHRRPRGRRRGAGGDGEDLCRHVTKIRRVRPSRRRGVLDPAAARRRCGGRQRRGKAARRDRAPGVEIALAIRPVTASFGVASLPSTPVDLAALLAAADEALYVAKSRGRNCCIVSASLSPQAPLGRKVLKAGAIVFNFGNSVIDCTVRRPFGYRGAARRAVAARRSAPVQAQHRRRRLLEILRSGAQG